MCKKKNTIIMKPIFYFEKNLGNDNKNKINCDIYKNMLTQCIYQKHSKNSSFDIFDVQNCYEQEICFVKCIRDQNQK